jgi:hypothetical protein
MKDNETYLEADIKKDEAFIKEQNDKYGINVCPECGSALIKQGGCKRCIECNYEACEL